MQFCLNCGYKLNPDTKFCPNCGTNIIFTNREDDNPTTEAVNILKSKVKSKSLFKTTTSALNKYTGDNRPVEINLKNLFSQVFQKHTQSEAEEIFIFGTDKTTPQLSDVSAKWGRPWLFSRVFLLLIVSFFMLLYMATTYGNSNAIPGMILTGAFAVPFSVLVFFFEMNSYKNISFYEILKIFFLGGVLSLFVTMYLYQFITFSSQEQLFGTMNWTDAMSVGIVEELGKLLIVVYFVRQKNYSYILNGILIGASVGAGFAAFETAGYIYNAGGQLLEVALLRAITAIGGHVVWTAISGSALVMVKGNNKFKSKQLFSPNFLVFFGLVILLHAFWDKGFFLLGSQLVVLFILIIVAWVIVLVMINAGLREVGQQQRKAKN